MSVELVDAQFLRLLGFIDCQRSFSSSMQANAALALAATKVEPSERGAVQDAPFPTDFVLSPTQSRAVQVGVDIFTYASKPPGQIWIAKHSLAWIQWLFVKSWFLIKSWHLADEQDAINNYRTVLIFVLRAQVGTSGDERSFDRCLLEGFVDFSSTVMKPEVVKWAHVLAVYERIKKILVSFKDDVEEIYTRVKSQEVNKFSQAITKKRVLSFLNQCFKDNRTPHQVFVFIQDLWVDVLIRVHLKEGGDSSLWEEVQTVTESLSRIFVPEHRKKDDFANCHRLKPLCMQYAISQDDNCLSRVNDVQNLVLGVLYGDPPPADMELPRFTGESDPWEIANTPRNAKVLDSVRSLKPGQWIFVPGEEAGYQLQQLLVIVEETGHYIFVNKGGLALGVRPLLELIEELQLNKLEIIGEDIVFARYAKQLVVESFGAIVGDSPAATIVQKNQLIAKSVSSELASRPRPTPMPTQKKMPKLVLNEELSESPAMKAARRTLSQLSVGDWVELLVEGRDMTRCKLSVRLPSVKRCSFVSALGVTVADMHEDDLAQCYIDGKLRLVQDESLETLEALMGNRPVDLDGS